MSIDAGFENRNYDPEEGGSSLECEAALLRTQWRRNRATLVPWLSKTRLRRAWKGNTTTLLRA